MSRSSASDVTILAAEVATLVERYAPGFAANGDALDVRVRSRRWLPGPSPSVVTTVRWRHGGFSRCEFPAALADEADVHAVIRAVRAHVDLLSGIEPFDDHGPFAVI